MIRLPARGPWRMLCARAVVAAILISGACVAAAVPAQGATPRVKRATTAAAPAGGYTALPGPVRLLDTRAGTGAPQAPVGAGRDVDVSVAGHASVPSGAAAVLVNITAISGTSSGTVTAYPTGGMPPNISNLIYSAGHTEADLALVGLDSNGRMTLHNASTGSVQLVADISGYVSGGSRTTGSQGAVYTLSTARELDTANHVGVSTTTAVPSHASVTFTAAGVAGVPTSASAVALHLTALSAGGSGSITADGSGSGLPPTSNLTVVQGQNASGLALTPVGDDGAVTLYNGTSGSIRLVADVQGYVTGGDPLQTGQFGALTPTRPLDTRTGAGTPVAANNSTTFTVDGHGGVPRSGVSAVALVVHATSATQTGVLDVYAGGSAPPDVSALTFTPGYTAAKLVIAPVSSSGTVSLRNRSGGTVQVIADVYGYVLGAGLNRPPTSHAHYVRAVTGSFVDSGSSGVGCSDAKAGSTFVLLDIGAQTKQGTGVELTATDTVVSYDDLVQDVADYAQSYRGCTSADLELALGTNNDGEGYNTGGAQTGTTRGNEWAQLMQNVAVALSQREISGVTLDGADDIESGFASTEPQAQAWENAYLGKTGLPLVFNGSADGCPSSYDAAAKPCAYGWTQAQYYSLAHGSTGRISALPQIYVDAQARQWANIDRLNGNAIRFTGSLTENAAGCSDLCDMTPSMGWASLYHAISTTVTAPAIAHAVDLDIVDG